MPDLDSQVGLVWPNLVAEMAKLTGLRGSCLGLYGFRLYHTEVHAEQITSQGWHELVGGASGDVIDGWPRVDFNFRLISAMGAVRGGCSVY